MERDRIKLPKSKKKLLLNAEPFGFGPSVAVASIFPHLYEMFEHIGFIGKDHTLDVQKGLTYKQVEDISGLSRDAEDRRLKKFALDYDVFFTAMDFPLVKRMHDFGIQQTCRYDALTWYWPELPEALGKNDLYIAQDFFGVRERLRENESRFAQTEIVPPLVPEKKPKKRGEHILLNLGGLQNPLWSVDETTLYARRLIAALYDFLPAEDLIISTSETIAKKLGSKNLVYTRKAMKEILATSKYAFMTPGLGNINDSAIYDIPTIWLPPANDSQGQQLSQLKINGMIDGSVDWSDIGISIDYYKNQGGILEQIAQAVRKATLNVLTSNLEREYLKIRDIKTSKTSLLLDRFGENGEKKVAELVYQFAENPIHNTYSTQ